ncbi:hypothetical protein [Mesorhizobium sp. B2-1-3A]|uniref:hypothetical protein n=1 Tax=Mesorhizobium sp. B2-1-3A TaxID=2589971 RepID=UPI0015E4408F|nr:hypothetical protein [Mesorhizobium sp. B2-1-3A]
MFRKVLRPHLFRLPRFVSHSAGIGQGIAVTAHGAETTPVLTCFAKIRHAGFERGLI